MATQPAAVEWGKVLGTITIPEHLFAAAQAAGLAAYAEAEDSEFCGDEVVWLPEEPWHNDCAALFPEEAVRAQGYELATRTGDQFRVYSTHGTDPHIDGEGATFVLVLANDGLKFKQGKHTHVTKVGEWFLFDDRVMHTVKATRRSTSYVFLHRTLRPIS
ncbi:hypothetical protein [Burkholderia ambifaria]|uniref:hypothetical protein n=1 Tax=Burkholderia ambifaria TaxID=152480 RepID=UPI000F815E0E|nr:hypothetical protein [Burkholderia ambifaria]